MITYRIQKNNYNHAHRTHWQLQGTEWKVQQYEKGNRNYKQEPGINEEYNIKNKKEKPGKKLQAVWIENQISKLEDKVDRNTQVEKLHEWRLKKYEDSLRELEYNMKHNNIWIIGILEGEEKDEGIEKCFGKKDRKLP